MKLSVEKFEVFAKWGLQVPDLIRKYPFTGAAEVLGRGGSCGDARERLGASEVFDWAVALRDWRYGLVFGSWLFCSLTLMDN